MVMEWYWNVLSVIVMGMGMANIRNCNGNKE